MCPSVSFASRKGVNRRQRGAEREREERMRRDNSGTVIRRCKVTHTSQDAAQFSVTVEIDTFVPRDFILATLEAWATPSCGVCLSVLLSVITFFTTVTADALFTLLLVKKV